MRFTPTSPFGQLSVATAIFSLLLPLSLAVAGASAELIETGKRLYQTGETLKPSTAYLSGPDMDALTTAFSCLQCHGADGKGTKEGGVKVPDIRFSHLSQSYAGQRQTGRVHPAYDEPSLKRAIRDGVDPGGNPLDPQMPRYHLSDQDMEALLAYLKRLDNLSVPGVSEGKIRIGTLQPNQGSLTHVSLQVRRLLREFVRQVNRRGGIYGRMLELEVAEFDPQNQESIDAALLHLLQERPVFCLLADLGLPVNSDIARTFAEYGVPEIGPLRLAPESAYIPGNRSYYLYTSLADQGRILVDYFLDNVRQRVHRTALVYADNPLARGGARGVRDQMIRNGLVPDHEVTYERGQFNNARVVNRLRADAIEVVYFFGAGPAFSELLDTASTLEWFPMILGSAELIGRLPENLTPRQAEKIYLVSPMTNPDVSSAGMMQLSQLMQGVEIQGHYNAMLRSTFAAARLLEVGFEGIGRQLTRAGLVSYLNRLWKFDTGVMPLLTFNENLHVGMRGAYIVRLDAETNRFYRVSAWRETK